MRNTKPGRAAAGDVPDVPGMPAAVDPHDIAPPADEPQPNEPALSVGAVVTLSAAVCMLLVAFGIPVSPEQKLAIAGFLVAAGPIATALWTRRRVFSPETVRLLLASQHERGVRAGRKEVTG